MPVVGLKPIDGVWLSAEEFQEKCFARLMTIKGEPGGIDEMIRLSSPRAKKLSEELMPLVAYTRFHLDDDFDIRWLGGNLGYDAEVRGSNPRLPQQLEVTMAVPDNEYLVREFHAQHGYSWTAGGTRRDPITRKIESVAVAGDMTAYLRELESMVRTAVQKRLAKTYPVDTSLISKESGLELGAVASEVEQNLRDGFVEFLKEWDDGFCFARPDILKRYLEGRLEIHVHWLGLGHDNPRRFCLPVVACSSDDITVNLDHHRAHILSDCDPLDRSKAAESNQIAVLIDVVKATEDCQGVLQAGHFIRSHAWLRVLDDGTCLIRNARYFSPIRGVFREVFLGVERGVIVANQERTLVHQTGARRSVDVVQERGNDLIEAGAKQVQRLSCNDAQDGRWLAISADCHCDFSRIVRIEAVASELWVFPLEVLDQGAKFLDVVIGPLYSEENVVEK